MYAIDTTINIFTDYLFVPLLRPFQVGDRVLFRGKPGTIANCRPILRVDGHSWLRPSGEVRYTIRYDVTGATAAIHVDPAHGDDRLQHLTE